MSIVLTGFWHLIGEELAVYLAGLDCGDYTVAADGTIVVPYQSDPDTLLTPAYIKAISDAGYGTTSEHPATIVVTIEGVPVTCTVPLCVGYTYNSDGQLVRPDDEKEAHTVTGSAMGKKRRIHQYAVNFVDAIGIKIGTTFSNTRPAHFKTDGGTPYNSAAGFTGIHRETLDATSNYDNMLCWRISRPFPCTIAAISGLMETSES